MEAVKAAIFVAFQKMNTAEVKFCPLDRRGRLFLDDFLILVGNI